MLDQPAVSFADGERGGHRGLGARHQSDEIVADGTLNDRMGEVLRPVAIA